MYISKLKKYFTAGNNNLISREAWLKAALKNIAPETKILDAGAGELKYKKFCEHLEYTSQDFGQYNGEGNSEGLQTKTWDNSKLDIVSDIVNIPVKNSSFGAIMCVEVLEHLPRPEKAIDEFARILEKDGILILTAPFCSLTHFAPFFYQTGFSKYWYEKVLKEKGFLIMEIKANGNYFEYLAQEVKRLTSVAKKYSRLNIFMRFLIDVVKYPIIFALTYLSKKNRGSEELLCFGFNIIAKKE